MSEHVSPNLGPPESVTLESGLEALQTGQEFRGPVERLDGHHCNDHFAQIYETNEERFAAAVPFVRHGLEGDERVMYVVDKSSEVEVQATLRDAGIDVDAALDSGALSFHTIQETYLRGGSFDPDEMIDFYGETVAAATQEYKALRIVAETAWLRDDDTTVEQFMEYEARVNDLFADEDCLALCQYDRDGFPPEIVENIVQTHPHLIYDGAVCHNFYYTPPAEFFGSDDPARKVDRMLGTLRERTEAKTELAEHERFLRECYEITSDPELSFETKVEHLLDLGQEWFSLDMAGLHHLPSWDGKFRLETGVGLGVDPEDEPLITDPGDGCFCRQAITADAPVGMADVRETDWQNDQIHEGLGLTSYLGTKVTSGSTPYGTLWFGSTEPRDRPFSDTERTFIELMGQWVSYELEQREHKQSQRELYEITADNELSTDEKFERMLELGCEYLDLPLGMLTREREDAFEIEQMHGTHPDLGEGTHTPPMTDNYCRRVVDTGEPISVADAGAAGWDEDALYHEFGLECYAGVQLTVGDDAYGTICFTDLSPREAAFTEAEQTFLDLMGQCASYELERNHREDQLQQTNDRLESFASMLAHELRNPVTIGQIYGQQLPAETDAEAVEYVTEAFDRIEDMIDVMLVLTRGREAVGERTPVSLATVAEDVWDDVDAPDATLDVTLDHTIQADETYVRHLLRNLFENAVEHGSTSNQPSADNVHQTSSDAAHQNPTDSEDAVEHGSTSPRSGAHEDAVEHGGEDVSVTVGELPTGFYVADDGPGVPPEERDAVFEAGYTTTADTGGTGLGLAFVQKLAEVYEWDYAVTESADGGAQFEFHVA